MYNQVEAILSQYELEIHEVRKGRGSYICNTDKGIKVVTAFSGSKEKGLFLKYFLEQIMIPDKIKNGLQIEQIMLNKNGEAVTTDEMTGETFLLKDYITGRELDTEKADELKSAVRLLADYKRKAEIISFQSLENFHSACLVQDTTGTESSARVIDIRKRHQRELVKVRNFIRKRKKRNGFEQLFLSANESMQSTMQRSIEILEKHPNAKCMFCHGDVNQHNILYEHGNWRLVNFENFTYSWQVLDMANFFRKIMEKNNWNVQLGLELIELYQKQADLEKDQMEQLYGLLLFPEKFWKVSNHYMNSRKNWVSQKDVEKLKKVVEQEEKRLYFMEQLYSRS